MLPFTCCPYLCTAPCPLQKKFFFALPISSQLNGDCFSACKVAKDKAALCSTSVPSAAPHLHISVPDVHLCTASCPLLTLSSAPPTSWPFYRKATAPGRWTRTQLRRASSPSSLFCFTCCPWAIGLCTASRSLPKFSCCPVIALLLSVLPRLQEGLQRSPLKALLLPLLPHLLQRVHGRAPLRDTVPASLLLHSTCCPWAIGL